MATTVVTLNGLHVANEAVPSLTNVERALLVLLAWTSGGHVTRDWLVGVLWDEASSAARRHSLSQVLYQLRRKLPDVQFRGTSASILVDRQTLSCDAREFVEKSDAGDFDGAIRLFRQPFLLDGVVPPSRAYEEWVDGVRQVVDAHARRMLALAIDQAKAAGDWPKVEALADRLISIDRFDETGHAARLTAIAASGRPDQALRQHRELALAFQGELGRTLSHPAFANLSQVPVQSSPVLTRFVGRDSEVRELTSCLEDVIDHGRSRIVLVCGEAGIGKSRLAEHFVRFAALRGARIMVGRCMHEEASLPFSAIASALRDAVRTIDLRRLDQHVLANLRPVIAESVLGEPVLPPSPFNDTRFAALEVADAFSRLVENLAMATPLVIFLDDCHWADEESALVVSYLRARLPEVAFLLLCTYRREELSANAMSRFVRSGSTHGPHRVIDLQPLSESNCYDLFDSFESSTTCTVSDPLRHALYVQTAGHPFFIVEALKDHRFGRLKYTLKDTPDGPEAIVSLPAASAFLRGKLAALDDDARSVVEVIAVAGGNVPALVVGSVLGLDVQRVAEVIHDLTIRGFVLDATAGLHLAHGLLAEAAYESLPLLRRQQLHRELAERIKDLPFVTVADLARHYDAAGEKALAYAAQVSAAKDALRANAYGSAEFFIRRAILSAPSPDARTHAERQLMQLLVNSRRVHQATPYAQSLRPGFAAESDLTGLLLCDVVALCEMLWNSEMPSSAILRDALRLVTRARASDDPSLLALLLPMLAESAHDAGREEFLMNFARGLSRRATEAGVTAAGATLFALAARLACLYTSASRAVEYGSRATALAREVADIPLLVNCLISLATAEMRAGALRPALATFEEAIRIVDDARFEYLRKRIVNNYAVCLMESGRQPDAVNLLQGALLGANVHDRLFLEGNLALVLTAMDMGHEAAAIAESLLIRNQVLGMPWLHAFACTIIGLDRLAHGELHEAAALASEVRNVIGRRQRLVSDQSYVEIFLARVEHAGGQVNRALEILEAAHVAMAPVNMPGALRIRLEKMQLTRCSLPVEGHRDLAELRSLAERVGAMGLVSQTDALAADRHDGPNDLAALARRPMR